METSKLRATRDWTAERARAGARYTMKFGARGGGAARTANCHVRFSSTGAAVRSSGRGGCEVISGGRTAINSQGIASNALGKKTGTGNRSAPLSITPPPSASQSAAIPSLAPSPWQVPHSVSSPAVSISQNNVAGSQRARSSEAMEKRKRRTKSKGAARPADCQPCVARSDALRFTPRIASASS